MSELVKLINFFVENKKNVLTFYTCQKFIENLHMQVTLKFNFTHDSIIEINTVYINEVVLLKSFFFYFLISVCNTTSISNRINFKFNPHAFVTFK